MSITGKITISLQCYRDLLKKEKALKELENPIDRRIDEMLKLLDHARDLLVDDDGTGKEARRKEIKVWEDRVLEILSIKIKQETSAAGFVGEQELQRFMLGTLTVITVCKDMQPMVDACGSEIVEVELRPVRRFGDGEDT